MLGLRDQERRNSLEQGDPDIEYEVKGMVIMYRTCPSSAAEWTRVTGWSFSAHRFMDIWTCSLGLTVA